MLRSFPGVLEWGVILIYEDYHLHACLLIGSGDNGIKTVCKLGCRIRSDIVFLLIRFKADIEIRLDSLGTGTATAHVKSDNRILIPFLFHLHDFETFEEILSA